MFNSHIFPFIQPFKYNTPIAQLPDNDTRSLPYLDQYIISDISQIINEYCQVEIEQTIDIHDAHGDVPLSINFKMTCSIFGKKVLDVKGLICDDDNKDITKSKPHNSHDHDEKTYMFDGYNFVEQTRHYIPFNYFEIRNTSNKYNCGIQITYFSTWCSIIEKHTELDCIFKAEDIPYMEYDVSHYKDVYNVDPPGQGPRRVSTIFLWDYPRSENVERLKKACSFQVFHSKEVQESFCNGSKVEVSSSHKYIDGSDELPLTKHSLDEDSLLIKKSFDNKMIITRHLSEKIFGEGRCGMCSSLENLPGLENIDTKKCRDYIREGIRDSIDLSVNSFWGPGRRSSI